MYKLQVDINDLACSGFKFANTISEEHVKNHRRPNMEGVLTPGKFESTFQVFIPYGGKENEV